MDEIQEVIKDKVFLGKLGEDVPRIKQLQQTDSICNRIYTLIKSGGRVFHPDDANVRQTEKWASKCVIEEGLLYNMDVPYENAQKENNFFYPSV